MYILGCGGHGNCKTFQGQCWCFVKKGITQGSVCGYPKGYSGKYYSIVKTKNPVGLIKALGQKPSHRGNSYCTNSRCNQDCANNVCDYSGCWGTKLTCWSNKQRWARKHSGIVRCTNYERSGSSSKSSGKAPVGPVTY